MNIQSIILLIIIVILLIFAIIYSARHKNTCHGDCANCNMNCGNKRKHLKKYSIDKDFNFVSLLTLTHFVMRALHTQISLKLQM